MFLVGIRVMAVKVRKATKMGRTTRRKPVHKERSGHAKKALSALALALA